MDEESITFREYLPFLALLLASVFVFSAMRDGGASAGRAGSDPVMAGSDPAIPAMVEVRTEPLVAVPQPQINAHAYLVKIIGEDGALLSQRSWKPLPPASLTKILTALVAYEELPAAEKIRFSEDAKRVEEKTSSAKAGEIFARNDVIRLALIGSANDAALALAESVGAEMGGATFEDRVRLFVWKMNERARELGMLSSEFKNPAGLDEEGHLSTAEDVTRLAEYTWFRHKELWENSRIISAEILSESGNIHKVVTTNDLLKEFPAILGGKTGFTDEAKGTLIMLYPMRPDKVAVIVILGSDDRFGDGRKIIQWLEESF